MAKSSTPFGITGAADGKFGAVDDLGLEAASRFSAQAELNNPW
jgi:hypothetical protein